MAESSKETEARLASLKGTGALDEAMARQKIAELPKPDDRAAVFALAQQVEAGGDKGVARELYLHYVKRWPRDDKSFLLSADVSQRLSLENALSNIVAHWGVPHGLINNAAIDSPPNAPAS